MRVPPSQSLNPGGGPRERVVRVAVGDFARDVGEPRREHEGVDPSALLGERVEKVEEQPRIAGHGPRDVDDRGRAAAGGQPAT